MSTRARPAAGKHCKYADARETSGHQTHVEIAPKIHLCQHWQNTWHTQKDHRGTKTILGVPDHTRSPIQDLLDLGNITADVQLNSFDIMNHIAQAIIFVTHHPTPADDPTLPDVHQETSVGSPSDLATQAQAQLALDAISWRATLFHLLPVQHISEHQCKMCGRITSSLKTNPYLSVSFVKRRRRNERSQCHAAGLVPRVPHSWQLRTLSKVGRTPRCGFHHALDNHCWPVPASPLFTGRTAHHDRSQ